MSPPSLPLRRLRAATVLPRRATRLERLRVRLADGARTTLHVATYELGSFSPRVVAFEEPIQLVRWCRSTGARHAVVGGFFARPQYAPLGQLWIEGVAQSSVPFDAPWGDVRACVHIDAGALRVGRRDGLELRGGPAGDLLQAGPLLVRDGLRVAGNDDAEGFSAGSRQFDSDITVGRYPRAALGLSGDVAVAVACDGRTRRDAGMTLPELADTLVSLGVTDGLNLDGGGSASLVHDGRLRNRPREQHGVDLLDGRPVVTAIVFDSI
jgi:Phosphodiester glycosidase